jgi:hypothetical protein
MVHIFPPPGRFRLPDIIAAPEMFCARIGGIMSERRRRRRSHSSSGANSRSQALWIAGAVALALAAGFIYLVASVAYSGAGRKPTDSNLKAGVITLPNTAIPAADGPVAPIIITEPNRGPADAPRSSALEPNWVEVVGAAGIVLLLLVLGPSNIGIWMQTRLLAKTVEKQYRDAERAFLHIDIGDAEETITRGGTEVFRITIGCINNGRTPTRYGLGHVNWHYFDESGPEIFSFKDFWTSESSSPAGVAIGPKGTVSLAVIEIPKAEILKSPGSVFCWGWVDYNDIFEESPRHRTEFCFEIASIARDGKSEIRYRNHRLHNGYDDECFRPPALYTRSSI